MTTDWVATTKSLTASMRELRGGSPDVMKAFVGLAQSALQPKALDVKTKELIALAIGVSIRCDDCIAFHAKAAVEARGEQCRNLRDVGDGHLRRARVRQLCMRRMPSTPTSSLPSQRSEMRARLLPRPSESNSGARTSALASCVGRAESSRGHRLLGASTQSAIPWPPPMHMVTIPRFMPSRCIEWSSRVV